MGFLSSLGFGGGKTKTPATGFYATPAGYQNLFNNSTNAANSMFFNNGQINPSMFTPEGSGYQSMLNGFAPTAQSLNSDIAMQMNPYDNYVTDEINRQAGGQYSMLGKSLAKAGQFGSNRALLGANDIDLSRMNQIGSFKQQGYNTALQNAMTTLPGLRAQDAQMNFDMTMQGKQAPYSALQAAYGLLGGTPTSFGSFGGAASSVKNPIDWKKIAGTAATLFSDRTVKENIVPVGIENGFNIYEFNYIGDPSKKFIGVIAQEVQEIDPSAVVDMNGILAVDYHKIGVEFREAA